MTWIQTQLFDAPSGATEVRACPGTTGTLGQEGNSFSKCSRARLILQHVRLRLCILQKFSCGNSTAWTSKHELLFALLAEVYKGKGAEAVPALFCDACTSLPNCKSWVTTHTVCVNMHCWWIEDCAKESPVPCISWPAFPWNLLAAISLVFSFGTTGSKISTKHRGNYLEDSKKQVPW